MSSGGSEGNVVTFVDKTKLVIENINIIILILDLTILTRQVWSVVLNKQVTEYNINILSSEGGEINGWAGAGTSPHLTSATSHCI